METNLLIRLKRILLNLMYLLGRVVAEALYKIPYLHSPLDRFIEGYIDGGISAEHI